MSRTTRPSHRVAPSPDGRRRSSSALGARCLAAPVLVGNGLAALQAALRAIPSRRPTR